MPEVTEAEVLKSYPEGRVVKMSDGSIKVEGVYDEDAAPLRGRHVLLSSPLRKSAPQPAYGTTLHKGLPIVAYREVKPWEQPPAPPPDTRLQDEERAREAAFLALDEGRRVRPAEPAEPVMTTDERARRLVMAKARENARIVALKWEQGA